MGPEDIMPMEGIVNPLTGEELEFLAANDCENPLFARYDGTERSVVTMGLRAADDAQRRIDAARAKELEEYQKAKATSSAKVNRDGKKWTGDLMKTGTGSSSPGLTGWALPPQQQPRSPGGGKRRGSGGSGGSPKQGVQSSPDGKSSPKSAAGGKGGTRSPASLQKQGQASSPEPQDDHTWVEKNLHGRRKNTELKLLERYWDRLGRFTLFDIELERLSVEKRRALLSRGRTVELRDMSNLAPSRWSGNGKGQNYGSYTGAQFTQGEKFPLNYCSARGGSVVEQGECSEVSVFSSCSIIRPVHVRLVRFVRKTPLYLLTVFSSELFHLL